MVSRIIGIAMILSAAVTWILLKHSNENNKWVRSGKIFAVIAILLAVAALIVSFF